MRVGITALIILGLTLAGCSHRSERISGSEARSAPTAPEDARATLESAGVEAYPKARPAEGLNVVQMEIPEGTAYTTTWSTTDPAASVIAFYKDRLRDAETNNDEMKDMVVGSTVAGDSVTVVTSPDGKRTLITITVRKNRN